MLSPPVMLVNIGSGNVLLPDGSKPYTTHAMMFTYNWLGPLVFILLQFQYNEMFKIITTFPRVKRVILANHILVDCFWGNIRVALFIRVKAVPTKGRERKWINRVRQRTRCNILYRISSQPIKCQLQTHHHDLVQDYHILIAITLEILQSCTK